MSVFKEKAKDFASAGLNKLPDRANLFLRYMTGIGGRNLDLDDKTVSQIRDSTKESTATGEPGGRFGFEPDESFQHTFWRRVSKNKFSHFYWQFISWFYVYS